MSLRTIPWANIPPKRSLLLLARSGSTTSQVFLGPAVHQERISCYRCMYAGAQFRSIESWSFFWKPIIVPLNYPKGTISRMSLYIIIRCMGYWMYRVMIITLAMLKNTNLSSFPVRSVILSPRIWYWLTWTNPGQSMLKHPVFSNPSACTYTSAQEFSFAKRKLVRSS